MRSSLKDWLTLRHGKREGETSIPGSLYSSWVVHRASDSMVYEHSISLLAKMLTEFIAIQFARLSGFSPIITTASLYNSELLSSLGATHVLDRRLSAAALKHAIAKITSTPITLAFDAVSLPDTQQAAHDILTAGGILIIVTEPTIEDKSDDKEVRLVWGSFHPISNHDMGKRFMPVLTQWLADGTIKVSRTSMQNTRL
jgi:NADPH:quinone reductase-like Zn-dependent oxidoreductase